MCLLHAKHSCRFIASVCSRNTSANTSLTSTPWVTKLLPITSPTFTHRLRGKFATNLHLHIPPDFKYVVTLPCEIWMSVNWRQSEICSDQWCSHTSGVRGVRTPSGKYIFFGMWFLSVTDCTADLVGQLNGNGQNGMLQTHPLSKNFWLRHWLWLTINQRVVQLSITAGMCYFATNFVTQFANERIF